MRVTAWGEELRDDVRFTLRQLRHSPAFTLVATLTLALGIGANSAIFALADATLLRPLPFGQPDRLVSIREHSAATGYGYASPLNMLEWNSRSASFEQIAGLRRVWAGWSWRAPMALPKRSRGSGSRRASSTCLGSGRSWAGAFPPTTMPGERTSSC